MFAVIHALAVALIGSLAAQPHQSLSNQDKARVHMLRTFGPRALGLDVVQAAINHWADSPPEWGQGWKPFGHRYLSGLGGDLTRNSMQLGLNVALGHDPRYFRLGKGTVKQRLRGAARQLFVERSDSGQWRPPVAKWGSIVGSNIVSRYWLPESQRDASHIARGCGYSLASDFAFNVAREFLPDVIRKIRGRRP